MGRKSNEKKKYEAERRRRRATEKKYVERQKMAGKVRLQRWVTQEEKICLEEMVFPALRLLVEKWRKSKEKQLGV